MDSAKLKAILESHGKWLAGDGGERANLRNANLRYADLCGADLRNANLRYADLCGANLRDADLRNANLRDADLRNANLRDADLRNANLRDANLRGANLRDVDLCGADLRGANLTEKIVQIGPIGSRKSYTVYNATRDVVQCGCWNGYKGGTLEEFRARVDDVYKDGQYRKEYMAAIEFFQAIKNMEK